MLMRRNMDTALDDAEEVYMETIQAEQEGGASPQQEEAIPSQDVPGTTLPFSGAVPLSVVDYSPEALNSEAQHKKRIIRETREKAGTREHFKTVLTEDFGVSNDIPLFHKTIPAHILSVEDAAQAHLEHNAGTLAYRRALYASPSRSQTETIPERPPQEATAAPATAPAPTSVEDPFGDLANNMPTVGAAASLEPEHRAEPAEEAVARQTQEPSACAAPERPSLRDRITGEFDRLHETTPFPSRPSATAEKTPSSQGVNGVGKSTVLLRESGEPYTAMLLEDGNVVLLHEKTGKFTALPLEELKARFLTVEGRPIQREDFLAAGEPQRRNMAAAAGMSPAAPSAPFASSRPMSPGNAQGAALAVGLTSLMGAGIRFVGEFVGECLRRYQAHRAESSASLVERTSARPAPDNSRLSPRFGPVNTEGLSQMETYRAHRAARLYDALGEKMGRVEMALDALGENPVIKDFRLELLQNPGSAATVRSRYEQLLENSESPEAQDARQRSAVVFQLLREMEKDVPEVSRAFAQSGRNVGRLNACMDRFSEQIRERPESAFITEPESGHSLKEKAAAMVRQVREVLENAFRNFLGRKHEETPAFSPG